MKLFRERLLARLIERHATSKELAQNLVSWRHPGFSAPIGEPIPFEEKKAIEDVASCLVKAPLFVPLKCPCLIPQKLDNFLLDILSP